MTVALDGTAPATDGTAPATRPGRAQRRPRDAWADNLKVVLVVGVIIAHTIMAWTGVGNWVFTEDPVREPLLSLLILVSVIGALFGMPLFFLIAGLFTVSSFERKGLRGFLLDRLIRLGVPLLFFIVFLAPFVEYADPENAGWQGGFADFTWQVVWWAWPDPPAWGPTWFLAVLLLFSAVYAIARTLAPRREAGRRPLRMSFLAAVAIAVALASYLVRIEAPIGDEPFRLALPQAPGWIAGFALGVVGAESGWFDPVDPLLARRARHLAWGTVTAFTLVLTVAMSAGEPVELFAGEGTWQSLLTAVLEGFLIVSMPLWLIDLFRRRWNHQGRLLREASRAAFAAFVLHQVVLVGLVLVTHELPWPPEADFVLVSLLGVAGSFGLGTLLVRLPGVRRVL